MFTTSSPGLLPLERGLHVLIIVLRTGLPRRQIIDVISDEWAREEGRNKYEIQQGLGTRPGAPWVAISGVYKGCVYSYFEKGCGKKCAATVPKGNMGYDQYTVLLLFFSFSTRKHISMASRANSFKFLW